MVYKWVSYCYTKKYFKCIEYQVLRNFELNRKVKDNYENNEVLKDINEVLRKTKNNVQKLDSNRIENRLIKKIVEKIF